jgi:hypothetical protein
MPGFSRLREQEQELQREGILMDRRSFAIKAGLIMVGSAIGSPLVGCSDYEIEIPCLGPAAAPEPVAGTKYIRASEIGCALDCDLRNGRNKHTGGAATDDGPRIIAAMAGASASNPITLIIDGSALVSGLFLPAGGNWSIAGLGCGTGFFVKSGTNNDGIHNGAANAAIPFDPGPPVPPRGANVSLSNFTLNGNQGSGLNGNSTSGRPHGNDRYWFCGINLMNLDNITIENIVLVNAPAYHVRLSNVGNVTVTGCVMRSSGENTDGLHFNGPANDIVISNCKFATGDDSIALNCPEGYSGNISRVAVSGCTFNSWSLMRLYTSNGGPVGFKIDTVSVSNCTGRFWEGAFLIGFMYGSEPNSVASLTVSDCTLTTPDVFGISENFGSILVSNVTFIPLPSGVNWGSQPNHTCGFLRPAPYNGTIDFTGSSLVFKNCTVLRTGDFNLAAVILENGSKISNVEFNGFELQGSSSSVPELLNLEGGSVGQLVIDSLLSDHIKAPVEAGGFARVGQVSGAGVLATGWKFPDSVMADGVPYVSAGNDSPSIKVGGIVEPYAKP